MTCVNLNEIGGFTDLFLLVDEDLEVHRYTTI